MTLKRTMPPVHPGELLAELFEANGLKVAPTADMLKVSRQHLHGILTAQRPVSPEMAVKFGRLFGNGARLWSNMQGRYDVWRAEQKLAGELEEIVPA